MVDTLERKRTIDMHDRNGHRSIIAKGFFDGDCGAHVGGPARNLNSCGITDDDVQAGDLKACFEKVGQGNVQTL